MPQSPYRVTIFHDTPSLTLLLLCLLQFHRGASEDGVASLGTGLLQGRLGGQGLDQVDARCDAAIAREDRSAWHGDQPQFHPGTGN